VQTLGSKEVYANAGNHVPVGRPYLPPRGEREAAEWRKVAGVLRPYHRHAGRSAGGNYDDGPVASVMATGTQRPRSRWPTSARSPPLGLLSFANRMR
jgi:hypothetical protein